MTNQAHHEKYDSKNPIAQRMIAGFMGNIQSLIESISNDIKTVTECGCGQGHVNQLLEQLLPNAVIKGLDINSADLTLAKQNQIKLSTELYQKSIYDIDEQEQADLIVCCEVMEHLDDPYLALKKMAALQSQYYLFSVPNEPIWRILNFMRGKYMKDWGNTPDHCNHWSKKKFLAFVSQELEVIEVKKPFPWTMVLAKPK